MDPSLDLKQKFFSLKTLFSFLLAFAIIYLLVTRMDTAEVAGVIKNTSLPVYAAGFLVYYAAFPLRGFRFRIMLENNGCEARPGDLTRIIFISWFANCIAPAKLGDLFRAYLVKTRYCHSFAGTVGTIFAERVFDLFILYLLIGGSGLLAFRGKIPGNMMAVLQTGFIILAAVLAVLVLMRYRGEGLVNRLPEKARGIYKKFRSGTMSSFRNNGKIAALTTMVWLLEGISFYLVTGSIGMNISFIAVIFIGLLSALLTALPITPAGLGFVETAKVGVLLFFQVDSSIAVSAALLDRVINYWSLLLFGFVVYMATEHGKMQKEEGIYESNDSNTYL
ncbi:MAG: hypothetical protein CVU89_16165 [Firmicutes bacterium HGW-Firmicutes-14]|nr:MAG: hypothetical protein CVU89_16165 [Firmicutes bacterium HGW-Firmicutes-14]